MKVSKIAVGIVVACGICGTAIAGTVEPYVTDTNGEVVVSGSGECVRTGFWTPALAAESKFAGKCGFAKPAPVKIVRYKVSKKFDLLCNFNKVAPYGKEVDEFAKFIGGIRPEDVVSVTIAGFADPIGRKDYNVELSELRAGYIVSLFKPYTAIANKVTLLAKGPVSDKADCGKVKKFGDKVRCNAPNRRVTIVVEYMQPSTK